MALDLTKQAEAALRARTYYEQYEQRLSNYGALKAYMDGGLALLPKDTLEALKTAQNARSLVFPVLTKQALTVITANACTFTGQDPTSAKPSFSSISRGFAIKVYPKVAANNYISEMDQYANGMVNGIRSVLANLDTYGAGQLDSNKNTDLQATTLPGVSISSNAYQIDNSKRLQLYIYIPTLMSRNDADGRVIVNVMTTEGRALMLEYESKGQNNDQNLRGVLEGSLPSASGYRHYHSNRLSNGAGVDETHFLVPFGGIGLFNFIDSDASMRITDGVGNKKMYPMVDAIMGIKWAVTEVPICDDLSATYGAGYEACNGTSYRFLAEFSFMNAYSSDSSKPIHKVELLSGV